MTSNTMQGQEQGTQAGASPRGLGQAYAVLVFGVIAFAFAIPSELSSTVHAIGAIIGGVVCVAASFVQLSSESTRERWVIVPGWVCAGLGFGLNIYFAAT